MLSISVTEGVWSQRGGEESHHTELYDRQSLLDESSLIAVMEF